VALRAGSNAVSGCRLRLLVGVGAASDLLDVGLDRFAVLRVEAAGQLEHRLCALLLGQGAPHLRDLVHFLRATLAAVDACGQAEVTGGGAAGDRALRRTRRALALAAAGAVAAVTLALVLVLLLVLLLLDHLVEADEDFLLHLLGL